MTKQAAFLFSTNRSSDVPEEFRKHFIRQLEEWEVEQQRQRDTQTTALFSEDEVEQLNAAIESMADKLGISEELATIDSLLQLRNARVARLLRAAYLTKGPTRRENVAR